MKCVALHVPVRWPRGVPTTPDLDQLGGGTQPTAFEVDLAELRGARSIGSPSSGATTSPGCSIRSSDRMSEASWLRWAYLHGDHHLRQFGH